MIHITEQKIVKRIEMRVLDYILTAPESEIKIKKGSKTLQSLRNELVEEVDKMRKSPTFDKLFDLMAHTYRYSYGNLLLAHHQYPNATMIASYTRWNKYWVQKIKKGETAIRILAPRWYVVKDEVTDEEVERKIYFKSVPVYDINQVEPIPKKYLTPWRYERQQKRQKQLNIILRKNIGAVEAVKNEEIERYLHTFQDFLAIKEIPYLATPISVLGGAFGGTDGKVIRYRTDLPVIKKFLTTLHEYAHYRLHYKGGELNPEYDREAMELSAQTVVYLVAKFLGLFHKRSDLSEPGIKEYVVFYLANWQQKKELGEHLQDTYALAREIKEVLLKKDEVSDSLGD